MTTVENDRELNPEALRDLALVGAQKRRTPKCWACHSDEIGHIQRVCPKRKDKLMSMHQGKLTEVKLESDR